MIVKSGTYRGMDLDSHIEAKIKLYDYKAVKDLRTQFMKYGNMRSIMKYLDLKYMEMSFHSISEVIVDRRIYLKEKAIGYDQKCKAYYYVYVDDFNKEILDDIRNKKYKMDPVRMIYIKEIKIKDSKLKVKDRPISIHSIKDLVLQTAINNLITEVIDKELLTNEIFGYREGIGVKDAVNKLEELISTRGVKYALVLDIKSFFDTINHNKLIKICKKYIKDKKVIALIREMIKPKIIDEKNDEEYVKEVGISQGSPISPTLANIYLDEVWDKYYRSIRTKEEVYMIRYADDVLMLTNNYNDVCKVKREAIKRFKEYDLEIEETKTKTIKLENNRIKYLGYEIEILGKVMNRYIPKDKIDTKKMKIRQILWHSRNDLKKLEYIMVLNKWVYIYDKYYGDSSPDLRERLYCLQYIMEINNMLWGMYRTYYDTVNYQALDKLTEYAKRKVKECWTNWVNDNLLEELIGRIRTRTDYMLARSNCN